MTKAKRTVAAKRRPSSRSAAPRSAKPSSDEIDEIVIAQADDDSAWEPAILVQRKQTAVGLPPNLAQRAAFLAQLHRERNLQSWVERVVRERVELEERAFTEARRELAAKRGA
jgi:hypothetical protein